MSWAIEEKFYSQRYACQLVGIAARVYRYQSCRSDDGILHQRLHDLSQIRHLLAIIVCIYCFNVRALLSTIRRFTGSI